MRGGRVRAAGEVRARDRDRADAQVDKRLAGYKHQFLGGSEARYLAELKKQGHDGGPGAARGSGAQLLGDAIFKKVSERATVSDDDIEAYYKAHLTGYKQPAKRQVRHILVKTKAEADKIER